MQVLSSGQLSLPPPPNLAGDVLSSGQLSLPTPPNSLVSEETLEIHRPEGEAAGKNIYYIKHRRTCSRET